MLQYKFYLVLLVSLLVACASPAQRVDSLAHEKHLRRALINGGEFQHVVYFNAAADRTSSTTRLNIYLEGDGTPWIDKYYVSADPTPRNPLALRLMLRDQQASAYLGRPCYYGLASSPLCHPLLWTHRRYAKEIVASMVAAATKLISQGSYQSVALIGYSGGGVMAMLMAEQLPQTTAIITVAANLDIDAWANLHQYSKLEGSLNPAAREPLNANVQQWHFGGQHDHNVPPAMIQAAIASQPKSTQFIIYKSFDHVCCWEEVWPELLAKVNGDSL